MKQDAQQIKQNPQKNLMKPKQTHTHTKKKQKKKKNQIKPTENTHSLCGFRFSWKRELENLKRKISVERNKPEVAEIEVEEELVSCS